MDTKLLILVLFSTIASSWSWADQNGVVVMMMMPHPRKTSMMETVPEMPAIEEQPSMQEILMPPSNGYMSQLPVQEPEMTMRSSYGNNMVMAPMEVRESEKMKDSVSMVEQMMAKWVEMMVKMKAMKKEPTPEPQRMVMEREPMMSKPDPAYQPPVEMNGGCSRVGEFLPVAGDECSFSQCSYGPEPWMVGGVIQVVPIRMGCPPGLAVDPAYNGGSGLPCTVYSTACHPPVPQVVETSQPEEQRPEAPVYMSGSD